MQEDTGSRPAWATQQALAHPDLNSNILPQNSRNNERKRKKCLCSIAFQISDFGAWGVCSSVKEFLVCMSWACAWHIKNKSTVNLKLLSVMVVLKVSDFTNDDLGCGFSDWEYSICIIQNFFQTTYHIIMYKIIFYIT